MVWDVDLPERGLLDQVVGVVVQDTLQQMLMPKETTESECVYMYVSVHVYMYMYVPLQYHNIVSLCAHLHAYLHYV